MPHHSYNYGVSKWPPIEDYFFWFGSWKSTLDVWIVFTLPLVALLFVNRDVAIVLLIFHYIYEVFLSKNVLDHNPKITSKITKIIPVGIFHLDHHKYFKCNYSFYISLWDYLFGTTRNDMMTRVNRKKAQRLHRTRAAKAFASQENNIPPIKTVKPEHTHKPVREPEPEEHVL